MNQRLNYKAMKKRSHLINRITVIYKRNKIIFHFKKIKMSSLSITKKKKKRLRKKNYFKTCLIINQMMIKNYLKCQMKNIKKN